MADSDKALDILIRLGILGKEDLVAFKQLMSETGQSAQELGSSLMMPESWQGQAAAVEKYGRGLKAAGEGAEGAGHHLHELRSLMAGAGPEAAELGHLLHFAFNPLMLGGAALAGGMELYFHWVEKTAERYKEMNETLQKHNEYLHELLKAGGNIYENQVKIAEAIADASAKQNSLTQQFKEFEERARAFDLAQNDALEERIGKRKAESDILQGQITMLEQMGAITKPQAEQAKIEAEHQEKLAAIRDKIIKDASDYNSAKTDYDKELKDAGGPGAMGPRAVGAAQAAALNAQNAFTQAQMDAGEKGADELRRLQQARTENRAQWDKHGTEWETSGPNAGQLKAVGYRQQQESLDQQIRTQEARMKTASDNLGTLAEAAKVATQKLEETKTLSDKFEAMGAKLNELRQKWQDDSTAAPKEIAEETQRAALEKVNALEKGGATPRSIYENAIAAMEQLTTMRDRTGHPPDYWLNAGTKQQREQVQGLRAQVNALGDLESAVGMNGDEVLAGISRIVQLQLGHQMTMQSVMGNVAALEARLAQLQAQAANGRTVNIGG